MRVVVAAHDATKQARRWDFQQRVAAIPARCRVRKTRRELYESGLSERRARLQARV